MDSGGEQVKEFAPSYPRNEQGWILFPSDTTYRAELFPEKVNSHPAKANAHLVSAIVDYVSEPGESIMDIMAGTGTILLAALEGRRVICIEISAKFSALQEQAAKFIDDIAPGSESLITLINAPCQHVLPLPCDHIIFSPPYANIMKSKGTDQLTIDRTTYDMAEYMEDKQNNVGAVNEWMYHQIMEGIYDKCYKSIHPGGTLTVILKDHMKDRKRVELSGKAARYCEKLGFELVSWHKWPSRDSLYNAIYRARGWEVVDNEDIITLRRPA